MTNNTIKKRIMESLIKEEAPMVVVQKIRGAKKTSNKITVDTLYVSMGECTGDEFEAIKSMREDIEMQHNISIINVLISL